MVNSSKPVANRRLLAMGAGTGFFMAVVTSFIGFPPAIEATLWVGFYALWLIEAIRTPRAKPAISVLGASLLSGLVVGLMQVALFSSYAQNNPHYNIEAAGIDLSTRLASFVGFGLAAGCIFGLFLMCIVWVWFRITRLRHRKH